METTTSFMNYDTWYAKAEKKIATMSPRVKIALFAALLDEFETRISEEIIHADLAMYFIEKIAETYDLSIGFDLE